jgi:hypothetical protein
MPLDQQKKPENGQPDPSNDYEAMARKIIAGTDDVWKSAVKRAEKRLADFENRQMDLEKAKLVGTRTATTDQKTNDQGLLFKPKTDRE